MTGCKNALKRLASHLQPGPKDVVAITQSEMESRAVHSDNETGVLLRNGGGATNGGPHVAGRHESSEDERDGGGIRVGRDYQAVPPPYISSSERHPEQCDEKALLIWSPTPSYLEECSVDTFLQFAKDKYNYSNDQALGMLLHYKYDVDLARQQLPNYVPFTKEWTEQDKILFEQSFQFHGKSFQRIRGMLPDKSIAALVEYYYHWKKSKTRISQMDQEVMKLTTEIDSSYTYSSESFFIVDESDEEIQERPPSVEVVMCDNCRTTDSSSREDTQTYNQPYCDTCHEISTNNVHIQSNIGPVITEGQAIKQKYSVFRNSVQPPKGMCINYQDLKALATRTPEQDEALVRDLDSQIVELKRKVQRNKQILSSTHKKIREIEAQYPSLDLSNKINDRWTKQELLLAVEGVRHFGNNFSMIASILGTKTESHVRSFYVNYNRHYNLDELNNAGENSPQIGLTQHNNDEMVDSSKKEEESDLMKPTIKDENTV